MNAFYLGSSAMLVFITLLFVYVAIKTKSNPFKYLIANRAMSGIGMVLVVTIIAVLTLMSFYGTAEASEKRWFAYTAVFAGLDMDINNQVFCYQGATSDRITSNVGARQNILEYDNLSINATYTHHSCAIEKDKPTYDAVGLQVEWKFRR